jgi:hypothetical protein
VIVIEACRIVEAAAAAVLDSPALKVGTRRTTASPGRDCHLLSLDERSLL